MARNIQKVTNKALRDLHARESMRLGWYRQVARGGVWIQHLRERKAQHQAFLMDLLRRRELEPAWYSRFFYYAGHLFGWSTAFLPDKFAKWVENTLEFWILMRYQRYLKELQLDFNLRSMVEAIQMRKLPHMEPGKDVLEALEVFTNDQEKILAEI